MKLLLGIFYSNFKSRFEQNLNKSNESRDQYFYSQFMKFGGEKGYLLMQETYKMFMCIHGLATGKNEEVTEEDLDMMYKNVSQVRRMTESNDRKGSQLGT